MDHYCPVCESFRSSFGFEPITWRSPGSCKVRATHEAGERLPPPVSDDNLMVSEDRAQAREGSGEELGSRADITPRRRRIPRDNPARFYGIEVPKKRKAKAA